MLSRDGFVIPAGAGVLLPSRFDATTDELRIRGELMGLDGRGD
jgi:hypothetical protein